MGHKCMAPGNWGLPLGNQLQWLLNCLVLIGIKGIRYGFCRNNGLNNQMARSFQLMTGALPIKMFLKVSHSRLTLCYPINCIACQAPLSMEFFRLEYWSGLPFPSPGDLPNPGIESGSPALSADSLPSEPPGKPLRCFWLLVFKKKKKKKTGLNKRGKGEIQRKNSMDPVCGSVPMPE